MTALALGRGKHAQYSVRLSLVGLIAQSDQLLAALYIPPFDGMDARIQFACPRCRETLFPASNICACGHELGFTVWRSEIEMSRVKPDLVMLMDLSGFSPLEAEVEAEFLLDEFRSVREAFNQGLLHWYDKNTSPFAARERPQDFHAALQASVQQELA